MHLIANIIEIENILQRQHNVLKRQLHWFHNVMVDIGTDKRLIVFC